MISFSLPVMPYYVLLYKKMRVNNWISIVSAQVSAHWIAIQIDSDF